MITENIKVKLSTTTDIILKVAAVVAAVTALGGGYVFYQSYLYRPVIQVLTVDFTMGTANISYNKNTILIQGDATYSLNGQWGVRFGSKYIDGKLVYDRLELVRQGMVYEYLQNPSVKTLASA
jgi:hypothetical protein